MKKLIQKIIATSVLVLVVVFATAIAIVILNAAEYCLNLAEIHGWARYVAMILVSVTIALDIAVWAEINLIALVAKAHVCDVWRDCTINDVKPCRLPFSVIRKIVKEW